MSKVTIKRMRESDLAVVSELAMLANPHAVKEKYSKLILDELRKNPDSSFVAIDDGKVVGYVLADTHNGDAVLEDIAVAKKYQRKNVGKRLLEKELKVLKRKGVKIVLAEVHYKCASAIPFYYKHNFRITGFAQDFFGISHDAIILKLVLQ
jgi:ribosomal protein S18 acetylase RimI-like enzyme